METNLYPPLILFCGFGGLLFWLALKEFKKFKLIEDVPVSRLKTAREGFIRAQGVALSLNLETFTNLAGKSVVYKSVEFFREVVKRDSKNQTSKTWDYVKKEVEGRSFYLKDESGVVLVTPSGFEVDGVKREYFKGGGIGISIPILDQPLTGAPIKLVETSIPENSSILILGQYQYNQVPTTVMGHPILGSMTFDPKNECVLTTRSAQKFVLYSKLKFIMFLILSIGSFILVYLILPFEK